MMPSVPLNRAGGSGVKMRWRFDSNGRSVAAPTVCTPGSDAVSRWSRSKNSRERTGVAYSVSGSISDAATVLSA